MMDDRQTVLVTGASSGIGFELARVFAKNNYNLIITAENSELGSKAKILRQYDVDVVEIIADLATESGVEELWDGIQATGRTLDIAVLNAGVGVGGQFITNDFEAEKNVMNLNMVYLTCLAKKVLQYMSARDEGKILFTSSIAAQMPGPYYAVYAASKAYVQSFAEALRYEMKDMKRNITITSLQPGPTDTEFFERANMTDTPAGEGKKDEASVVAQDGFDALMRGKDHVVAGSLKNALQATSSKFMSEPMAAAAQGKQAKPNSLNN